jgi:hypothetical protein
MRSKKMMKRLGKKKMRKRMKKKKEKTMKKREKMTMKKWRMNHRGKHRESKGAKMPASTCII